MATKEQLKPAEEKMKKVISRLEEEFVSIRAGRANPSILDKIQVEYYGTLTPINQMAAVSVSEGRILLIQPWDASLIKLINKSLLASDLGITPTDDGKVIRLVFPQLTEERRKELCKTVKKYGDEAKVSIRGVRRDILEKFKTMKKNSEITEDDLKTLEKDCQTLTDKYVSDIDKSVANKEKEIMSL